MSNMKLSYVKNGPSRRVLVSNLTAKVRKPCEDGTVFELWHAPVVDFTEVARMLDAGFPKEWVEAEIIRAVKGAKESTVKRYFVPAT